MPDIKHFDPDAVLETVVRLFWRQGVATTGIQEVVTATGLNRSSLYATFGGKQELYCAALRRYIDQRARPAFRSLAQDQRGLRAVAEFFDGLIEARCAGEHARWGCLVVNAHVGAENGYPEVRALLDQHHRELRDAMHTALVTAEAQGQLAPGTGPAEAAELLALLAYGVNLRSRAGADAGALHVSVAAALQSLGSRTVM
ncbi:AcrR family transcriptional regulator [Streptomyces griseochromogenes]|uniref:AcrR family transcriptional regulator n=1 Tax=Streptomyces griseochromogenes TaxID=68214 RepID=A0A1B1B3B9_9ACTN|nr:TetR/AcrR family transcriptional regulator [Streptomyces griseochromogenes]ANP53251.1 TetR family transcriptional regulator [Streptomyces griseochromogenes]MBP2053969.1 AcrR family transcriptional regulator [Streptomyces griseochromogenes]